MFYLRQEILQFLEQNTQASQPAKAGYAPAAFQMFRLRWHTFKFPKPSIQSIMLNLQKVHAFPSSITIPLHSSNKLIPRLKIKPILLIRLRLLRPSIPRKIKEANARPQRRGTPPQLLFPNHQMWVQPSILAIISQVPGSGEVDIFHQICYRCAVAPDDARVGELNAFL